MRNKEFGLLSFTIAAICFMVPPSYAFDGELDAILGGKDTANFGMGSEFADASAVSSEDGEKTEQISTSKDCFVGSTFFLLGNLATTNSPEFAQLNIGYRINPENVVSIEIKTWKYAWPLGIPYGKSYEAPEEKYPGYVRTYGVAIVYQHFFWKGAYAAVHAMNALQKYVDEDNKDIQDGYQLFMTYRLGYHVPLFENRFFIEPSMAITHWPINTNVPESFTRLDDKWPNYFLLEPGLHFGYNF